MVAGMLMPLERLRSILELLFREGVLVGERDGCPRRTHPQLPGVANVEVRRAMASLHSRGLVRQTAAWRHLYWYLTDAGIAHLRQYLRLPPDVVPRSLQRFPRPVAPRPDTRRATTTTGTHRARPTGNDRLYRRKDEGERPVEPVTVSAGQGVSQLAPQPSPATGTNQSPGVPPVISWVGALEPRCSHGWLRPSDPFCCSAKDGVGGSCNPLTAWGGRRVMGGSSLCLLRPRGLCGLE
ncbi:40S ribosomal protein S10 [Willisornis vidua]|uniref:40S ribosomal protein S10 n=1 Tax=Willisornis vidua TaxID=1566151 RepID=A0ABQ9CZC6_9PASS|nr:40S ribosomal protein S10 [Willisornis vidua]